MAINREYLLFVLDQLSEFGKVETKNMFGGIGIFKDGIMFAKIGGETFRLKVDETNQKQFEERGMKPFHSEKKKKGMPYWEVPQDILDNKTKLTKWASQSLSNSKSSKQITVNS